MSLLPSLVSSAEPRTIELLLSGSSLGGELSKNAGLIGSASALLDAFISPHPAALHDDPFEPQDRLTFPQLAAHITRAPARLRALPVTALETFQTRETRTRGLMKHQYVLATVVHPRDSARRTYVRLDMFRGAGSTVLGGDCVFAVEPSDERAALTGHGRDAYTRWYDVCGRNCMWMAGLVMSASAKRFREHWLAHGRMVPDDTFRRYMHGKVGALAAGLETTVPDGTARWFANIGLTVMRGVQSLLTQGATGDGRYLMHDNEVQEVVDEWQGFLDAAIPA